MPARELTIGDIRGVIDVHVDDLPVGVLDPMGKFVAWTEEPRRYRLEDGRQVIVFESLQFADPEEGNYPT